MKSKIYYIFFIITFLLFLTEKIIMGVPLFAAVYGDLTLRGGLEETTYAHFLSYLYLTLPQLGILIVSFIIQYIFFCKRIFEIPFVLVFIKYPLLLIPCALNYAWLAAGMARYLIICVIPFITFLVFGAVSEPLTMYRERKLIEKGRLKPAC